MSNTPMGNLVKIYSGNYRPNNSVKKHSKVIVFDLDETLGYFFDLVTLWYVVGLKKTQENFNALLDIYPEFLRYGILTILEFLYHKKKSGHCSKIYLYTNNRFSPEIPKYIAKYFDHKMGIHIDTENPTKTHFFDHVIGAFKIGNRIIEPNRRSHNKTHSDFIRCTLLPKNTEICFVDDVYHTKMNHNKIYYIQPTAYFHNLTKHEIIQRACAFMPDVYKQDYLEFLFFKYTSQHTNIETHILVAKKLMFYVKEFFYLSAIQTKTRKNRYSSSRFTRKR